MRDTARAPQPPTNLPTGHQMSQQGLAKKEQKCQKPPKNTLFALYYGQEWDEMSRYCQYLAQIDQKWAESLNSFGRKQKLGYQRNRKSI